MKIIYYYHIPKCGGTTINEQLKEFSQALEGEYYGFNFPMKKFSSLEETNNNNTLISFLERLNNKSNDLKFIHHHHGFYGISEIFDLLLEEKRKAICAGNEFHLFTCVRNPLSFQLSQINYLKNSCGMTNLSFDDACKNSAHQNFMFKYFLYNHPRRWSDQNLDQQYFTKILGVMDKVFVLEKLNNLYDWLEGVVGLPVRSKARKANTGSHSLMPTEPQLELLQKVNTLDQFFYDSACNRSN